MTPGLVTTRAGAPAAFVGADLTDGRAARPRDVDVCGLDPAAGGFAARFWTWRWAGGGVATVAEELRAARCAMLDGPQALAAPGRSLRACERLTAAAGKTPDALARVAGPYAGFIRSSLALFAALDAAGLAVSPPRLARGVGEVYPGALWRALLPGAARKATALGRRQRAAALCAFGLRLDDGGRALSHDQLDAALAALVAAAGAGAAPGLTVVALGEPLARRATGELEEGPIASLRAAPDLAARVARAARAAR